MPVAFLFNRKLDGADDTSLADALSGCGYAMVSPYYELYLIERDFDVSQGLRTDSSVTSVSLPPMMCKQMLFLISGMFLSDSHECTPY